MIDEGVIKFDCEWTRGPLPQHAVISDLNRWRRPLFDAGLIGYCKDTGVGFGNISVRVGLDAHFVISGTQTGHLANLTRSHYAQVTDCEIQNNRVACRGLVKASSESLTHAAIYELDPAIKAIVHIHSEALWQELHGKIPTTNPGAAYGTREMAEEFGRLYRDTDFADYGLAVMAGHDGGLISIGHDMAEAAGRFLEISAAASGSGDKGAIRFPR